MAHLIDKHLVERANTALLLGILWGALVAYSGRWPMTSALGSKAGEEGLHCAQPPSPNWLNSKNPGHLRWRSGSARGARDPG